MADRRFLTNHARVLLCIAHDHDVRLRDIAATVGVTERRAHDMVTDLVDAGYVSKVKDGRRNRYRVQEHLPLPDAISRERTIGELLDLLGAETRHEPSCVCPTDGPLAVDRTTAPERGGTDGRSGRTPCFPDIL